MAVRYFYARTHADGTGTAGGGVGGVYSSQQTGDWDTIFSTTAEYYASMEDCYTATTPPVAGDLILLSDIHDVTDGGDISVGVTGNIYAYVVSVDDTDMAVAKAGATERTGAGGDLTVGAANKRQKHYGMTFEIGDDVYFAWENAALSFDTCSINLDSSGDRLYILGDRGYQEYINCIIAWALGTTSAAIVGRGGSRFVFVGSTFTATTGTLNDFIGDNITATNGGFSAYAVGCNLSDFTGYLVGDVGDAIGDGQFFVRIDKCTLGGSLTGLVEVDFIHPSNSVLITNSAATSAAAEYQYFYKDWCGTVQDESSAGIHRNESTAFTDGEKISFECITNTNVSRFNPLVFDAPSRFAELATASTDTIRIYFAVVNTTTLTDNDIWAEVIYPDGTNKHVFNLTSNANSDPLAAGTTHTTDLGSTWKDGVSDLTGYNEYYMDIDTSGDVGDDCVPVVRIHIGIPSETIYIDSEFDLVA